MGRFGSFNPTRPLLTALATARTASSCPITRLCKICSNFARRLDSPSVSFFTGIFVHWEITSAMVSSVTNSCFRLHCFSYFSLASSRFFSRFSCSLCNSRASSRSCLFRASSFALPSFLNWFSVSTIPSGVLYPSSWTLEHASSIRSMALSGKNRSFTYRILLSTAASIAFASIFTPWWFS